MFTGVSVTGPQAPVTGGRFTGPLTARSQKIEVLKLADAVKFSVVPVQIEIVAGKLVSCGTGLTKTVTGVDELQPLAVAIRLY